VQYNRLKTSMEHTSSSRGRSRGTSNNCV